MRNRAISKRSHVTVGIVTPTFSILKKSGILIIVPVVAYTRAVTKEQFLITSDFLRMTFSGEVEFACKYAGFRKFMNKIVKHLFMIQHGVNTPNRVAVKTRLILITKILPRLTRNLYTD